MIATITKQCACGSSFEAAEDSEWPFLIETECPACIEKRDAEREAENQRRTQRSRDELLRHFLSKLDGLTPDRLKTPNIDHPAFNGDLWRKVAKWNPTRERPWLGLVGETGACKTRCAFLRLREFLARDVANWAGYRDAPKFGVVVMTGMDFNRYVTEQYSKAPGESVGLGRAEGIGDKASRRLREARTTELLLLDELGKVRSSSGTVDELFALIDYRTSRNLVTLWTSNAPPERFCAAWPDEYASPGYGRIVEASTIILA